MCTKLFAKPCRISFCQNPSYTPPSGQRIIPARERGSKYNVAAKIVFTMAFPASMLIFAYSKDQLRLQRHKMHVRTCTLILGPIRPSHFPLAIWGLISIVPFFGIVTRNTSRLFGQINATFIDASVCIDAFSPAMPFIFDKVSLCHIVKDLHQT